MDTKKSGGAVGASIRSGQEEEEEEEGAYQRGSQQMVAATILYPHRFGANRVEHHRFPALFHRRPFVCRRIPANGKRHGYRLFWSFG